MSTFKPCLYCLARVFCHLVLALADSILLKDFSSSSFLRSSSSIFFFFFFSSFIFTLTNNNKRVTEFEFTFFVHDIFALIFHLLFSRPVFQLRFQPHLDLLFSSLSMLSRASPEIRYTV